MPLTHERSFRLRFYECDPQEILRTAVYLRYTQETAFDASAAAGYGQDRYRAMKRMWLIRETRLDFTRWLHFGDSATVTTWVADFRRVRSRRAYTLRNARTGLPVAHGYSDWAFLDLDTLRPVSIPEDLIAAFFPEGLPAGLASRDRFPELSPAPQTPFAVHRTVEGRDLDGAGHVNNAVYLDYLDEVLQQMLAASGWPATRLYTQGLARVPTSLRIEYRQPALAGDELAVSSWFSALSLQEVLGHATFVRARDGELLARAHAGWCCAQLPDLAPAPIPEDLLANLAPTRG